MIDYEPLAQAHDLEAKLARCDGRFDDAFYWSELAIAVRGGWSSGFRGIDQRAPNRNLAWLHAAMKEPYPYRARPTAPSDQEDE